MLASYHCGRCTAGRLVGSFLGWELDSLAAWPLVGGPRVLLHHPHDGTRLVRADGNTNGLRPVDLSQSALSQTLSIGIIDHHAASLYVGIKEAQLSVPAESITLSRQIPGREGDSVTCFALIIVLVP